MNIAAGRAGRKAVLVLVISGFAGLLALLSAGPAKAAIPHVTINGGSPFESIHLGNDLSCQVKLTADNDLSFYHPTSVPGDCGTFVHSQGTTFGPDFQNLDSTATGAVSGDANYTPFTPTGNTGVSGSGSQTDPYEVRIGVTAGEVGLAIDERTTYVTGADEYLSEIEISNGSETARTVQLYRAADCFLQNSDNGYGAALTNGTVLCTEAPNNDPPGRVIGFSPRQGPASHYLEANFSTVWTEIDGTPFPDTCICNSFEDNGVGLSWELTIPAGEAQTVTVATIVDSDTSTNEPPDTQIDSGPAAGSTISEDSATFEFSGDPAEDTAKIQCSLDGEPYFDCTSPHTFENLSEGSHTARFRAEDALGLQDPTPAESTFTVDLPDPGDPGRVVFSRTVTKDHLLFGGQVGIPARCDTGAAEAGCHAQAEIFVVGKGHGLVRGQVTAITPVGQPISNPATDYDRRTCYATLFTQLIDPKCRRQTNGFPAQPQDPHPRDEVFVPEGETAAAVCDGRAMGSQLVLAVIIERVRCTLTLREYHQAAPAA